MVRGSLDVNIHSGDSWYRIAFGATETPGHSQEAGDPCYNNHYLSAGKIRVNLLVHRYQIVRSLASGGFGETFLAKDTQLPDHPWCVVKQLKPQSDPQSWQIATRLFDTEARSLYQLGKHAQIPQLFAHFSENNQFYLVQEYIEGHPLGEEIILGKQWEEIAVIEFLEDVLSTLAFVHQHNVIHRDIKPDNLIRRKLDNKIILIDFGAVKQIINLSNTQNQPKTIGIGTPGYMSNEQNLGKPTFSSDIYSVGMIAIQMLTGYYPTQLVDNQTGEIHWQNNVKITPKFTDILVKMSHPDFQQRYPSAKEALQAIQGLQGVSPTMVPTIQKNGGKIAVIPLILMLLLGGVIGIGLNTLSERQQNNERQHQPAF